MIQIGSIVKNLDPIELVEVTKISPLGSKISITYTGVNTNRKNSKVIDKIVFDQLEVLTEQGSFNFTVYRSGNRRVPSGIPAGFLF
jgi:hypothetical protein